MRLPFLLFATALALAPRPADAAETFHTCAGFIDALPAVISTQGTWCLRGDLSTSVATGTGITVQTNNVAIDCNGYKIGALGAGEQSGATGILAQARRRVTVRNCTIRGFQVGIALRDISLVRGGHLVEDNLLDFQTWIGIWVEGHDSVIRRNQLLSVGGSIFDQYSAAIHSRGDVDIVDNLVADMLPARPDWEPDTGHVYALLVEDNGHGTVARNRLRRIVRNVGENEAWAILLDDSDHAIVEGNRLSNPEPFEAEHEVGAIRCEDGFAWLRDNIARGFSGPAHGCTDGGGNSGL